MTSFEFLTSAWSWKPAVLFECAALLIAYAVVGHSKLTKFTISFVLGTVVFALALLTPLALLADRYLFSAHTLQHLLLAQIVPPLLLLGVPPALHRQALSLAFIKWILKKPFLTWSVGIMAMVIWHIPGLHSGMGEHSHGFTGMEMALVITGGLFWWPIITPVVEYRLSPLLAVFYLFSACLSTTLVGIIIAFAPPGLYPQYLHPHDPFGILPLLRNDWGLSPAIDQQIGGLLMWLPCCLVYLTAILATLVHWYNAPEEVEALPSAAIYENIK